MRFRLLALLLLGSLGLVKVAQAFDVAPYKTGDVLSTVEAQGLMARYAARPQQPWREPDEARIPTGAAGEQIRDGIDLMRNTSQRVGNMAPDLSKRLSWNSLNCVNCHQAGPSGLPGTKKFTLSLINAINDYPKFDPKSGKIISLEQRTIGMFGPGSIKMTAEIPEFQAIMAYLRWLAKDSTQDAGMIGSGLMPIQAISRPADPVAGRKLYLLKCQACHGVDAKGQAKPDFASGGGYLFPPLAGDGAYDNAGHMFAIPLLARYIRASMPLGTTWDRPQLTVAEALDIAAFVNDDATPRKQNPNRMKLYPNPVFRPQGFAIPENFVGQPPDAYKRAKFGPFKNINEHY